MKLTAQVSKECNCEKFDLVLNYGPADCARWFYNKLKGRSSSMWLCLHSQSPGYLVTENHDMQLQRHATEICKPLSLSVLQQQQSNVLKVNVILIPSFSLRGREGLKKSTFIPRSVYSLFHHVEIVDGSSAVRVAISSPPFQESNFINHRGCVSLVMIPYRSSIKRGRVNHCWKRIATWWKQ